MDRFSFSILSIFIYLSIPFAFRNYIAEEHKDKKKSAIDMNEWTQVIPKVKLWFQFHLC